MWANSPADVRRQPNRSSQRLLGVAKACQSVGKQSLFREESLAALSGRKVHPEFTNLS
jgi:hypothetical protein